MTSEDRSFLFDALIGGIEGAVDKLAKQLRASRRGRKPNTPPPDPYEVQEIRIVCQTLHRELGIENGPKSDSQKAVSQ